jgi:hypothetical protein
VVFWLGDFEGGGETEKMTAEQIAAAQFKALQAHGIDGDVADFLCALNLRIDALERLVSYRASFEGAQHAYDCPGDDTCWCDGKEINETVQEICETYEANHIVKEGPIK